MRGVIDRLKEKGGKGATGNRNLICEEEPARGLEEKFYLKRKRMRER